jgi:aminoglycoside phosphotransferase (APT) family kinase protein
MLTYSLLPDIAGDLGLVYVRALRDGEFGASVVRDRDRAELVLKASSARSARQVARGGALAGRLRERGYPAPLLVATGAARGACWSLQELLPGRPPEALTGAHARKLVDLLALQRDAAGRCRSRRRELLARTRRWHADLSSIEETHALAGELTRVMQRCCAVELRDGDVVHNDFSHRNVLAIGDDVTGVIDWDLAGVGDWRRDMVSLGYWCAIEPSRRTPAAARIIDEQLRESCPAHLRAMFVAYVALRHLDYVAHAHPDQLVALVEAIEERVAPAWRESESAAKHNLA